LHDPYCSSGHWSLHAMDDFDDAIPYAYGVSASDEAPKKRKIKGWWGLSGVPTEDSPVQDQVIRLTADEAKERNDFIVARVNAGDAIKDVALEVGLSVVQTANIAKNWVRV
jgi:hypothetical protein